MSEVIINEPYLTVKEEKRLAALEGIVRENFLGFVAVGKALAEIRDKRLYRNQDNRTFEGYCRELWDMGDKHAYRLIDSSKVIENLSPIGEKMKDDSRPIGRKIDELLEKNPNFLMPINEAQARELARLEPEEQREVWQNILEHRLDQYKKGTFPKITAITVKKAVLKYKGKKLEVQIDQTTKETRQNKTGFESDGFRAAYVAFAEQLRHEQGANWRYTSRSKVFRSLSVLLDLVGSAGPKDIKSKGCSMEFSNLEKLSKNGMRIFKMRPKELFIEEWVNGKWIFSSKHETASQLSTAFKELMDDPRNLRA